MDARKDLTQGHLSEGFTRLKKKRGNGRALVACARKIACWSAGTVVLSSRGPDVCSRFSIGTTGAYFPRDRVKDSRLDEAAWLPRPRVYAVNWSYALRELCAKRSSKWGISMKKAVIILTVATLAILPFQFPVASAHYADCYVGMSGPGSVWCSWSCTAGHAIYVQTQTNNGYPAPVTGQTQCGSSGTAYCSSNGLCQDGDWASSHQDGAGCYGWSSNSAGLSTQCWEPGGSNTNWPLLKCDSLQCAIEQATQLALRVGGPLSHHDLTGVVVYDLVDHAVAFACTDDLAVCVNVLPTCALILDGKACWV